MIVTARQLQDLHKTDGHVRLPIGTRLTPMASDWLRAKRVTIVYGDAPVSSAPTNASMPSRPSLAPSPSGVFLWWCDGPCGQAKAALASQSKETNFQPMPVTTEAKHIVGAVKHLAAEIKHDRATAGVLLVQSGAAAVIFANRCPSLRAILGTCRDAVQQGVEHLAANVLIIEHPYQTLQQVRNLLSQFVRLQRPLSEETKRQLQELSSCG